jgi:hypothetical protein
MGVTQEELEAVKAREREMMAEVGPAGGEAFMHMHKGVGTQQTWQLLGGRSTDAV